MPKAVPVHFLSPESGPFSQWHELLGIKLHSPPQSTFLLCLPYLPQTHIVEIFPYDCPPTRYNPLPSSHHTHTKRHASTHPQTHTHTPTQTHPKTHTHTLTHTHSSEHCRLPITNSLRQNCLWFLHVAGSLMHKCQHSG